MVRLLGLDALRGVAAISVFVYHVVRIWELPGLQRGYLAVDFFFMLSGYVIARMLDHKCIAPRSFIWSRYKRFWPVMAVGTALGLFTVPFDPVLVIAGFLFIPVFLSEKVFPLNSPTWSIFFELFANAVHSITPNGAWKYICAASILAYLAIGELAPGATSGNFVGGFPRVLIAYSIGAMLFLNWRDQPPLSIPAWAGISLLFAPFLPVRGFYFDLVFVVLICPLIIASGLRFRPPWAKFSGQLSFPLYAVHFPFLTLLHRYFSR